MTRDPAAIRSAGTIRIRPRGVRRPSDDGLASIWMLGIGLSVVSFGASAIVASGVLVARQQARTAADLGALAGAARLAEGEVRACAHAGSIVEANAARLVRCSSDGLDLIIAVRTEASGIEIGAETTARAGPIRGR
ncbi:MAG: flp pilus-assembly TadE/G-like family protein [Dactylosporangium sp.]|nr:flp pilus-assembly TadE/G-like family protein [Dactylosporangium sp.]NNJ63025.1 flp pilus-assembly TadE/G-like family protein [Dactylosporangium sp.]